MAASFQQAVVDVLTAKTMQAAKQYQIRKIAVAGGVSANAGLRKAMTEACQKRGFELSIPKLVLCTDNAAMIGSAAYTLYQKGQFADLSLNAVPNLTLGAKN